MMKLKMLLDIVKYATSFWDIRASQIYIRVSALNTSREFATVDLVYSIR